MPGIGGGSKDDPPTTPPTEKGETGEQQGEPGTTGGDDYEGTPATAEWYYTAYGMSTAQYNMIKYAVLLFALSKVVK